MSEATTQLEIRQPNPLMVMIASAIDQKADPATIRELVQIMREERDYSAQMSFNQAMHGCQEKMKPIAANMENPQTRSKYASYDQIDRSIRPIYTGEGLSLSFGDGEPIASDFIRIICYVSHIDGHTRMYHKDMPVVTVGPQGKAVMTATHAHGSADQYAKRYLVKDIFNLAIGESDDDGNGGLKVTEAIAETVSKLLHCADLETLKSTYRDEYKAAVEANDSTAVKLFMDAYTRRKGELTNESA